MASQPQQLPPGRSGHAAGAAADAQPRPLGEEIALAGGQQQAQAAAGAAAPSMLPPPGAGAGVAAAGGVTVWQPNRTVNALWSINQNRNSWVGFAGAGWTKLANNSDSAIVAMTILVSHALVTQTVVGYRTEADGMLHEMYVW
jgi:hypothetical protein